jgi:hypothetical protein
MVEKYISINE